MRKLLLGTTAVVALTFLRTPAAHASWLSKALGLDPHDKVVYVPSPACCTTTPYSPAPTCTPSPSYQPVAYVIPSYVPTPSSTPAPYVTYVPQTTLPQTGPDATAAVVSLLGGGGLAAITNSLRQRRKLERSSRNIDVA